MTLHRSRRSGPLRWVPWLLALALLQAQALGQWHRIVHGHPSAKAAVAALADVVDTTGAATPDDDDVFGHAAGDPAQCRLYDAAGSAAGPWSAPSLVPVLATLSVLPVVRPWQPVGRSERPYEARAPPRG